MSAATLEIGIGRQSLADLCALLSDTGGGIFGTYKKKIVSQVENEGMKEAGE